MAADPAAAAARSPRGARRAAVACGALAWLGWSTVGFGLFYAPLAFAVTSSPGWVLAGVWQVTILAVVFAAGLEVLLLGIAFPTPLAWCGIALIVAGIARLSACR